MGVRTTGIEMVTQTANSFEIEMSTGQAGERDGPGLRPTGLMVKTGRNLPKIQLFINVYEKFEI